MFQLLLLLKKTKMCCLCSDLGSHHFVSWSCHSFSGKCNFGKRQIWKTWVRSFSYVFEWFGRCHLGSCRMTWSCNQNQVHFLWYIKTRENWIGKIDQIHQRYVSEYYKISIHEPMGSQWVKYCVQNWRNRSYR